MSADVSGDLGESCTVGNRDKLARLFGLIAVRAGCAIMKVREMGGSAQYKDDRSPVTAADLAADNLIRPAMAC